jgi:predicted phosphoribosyltransferase
MTNGRDYEHELTLFMNAMAESVAEMSEEEMMQELAENAEDPEQVRELLRRVVKECQQRPLVEAQRRYEEHVAALEDRQYDIPNALDDQRKMITSILASNPQLGTGLLTAQYRDLNQLSDEDVESYLRQLLALTEKHHSSPEK